MMAPLMKCTCFSVVLGLVLHSASAEPPAVFEVPVVEESAVGAGGQSASRDVLWDNGIIPNGQGSRALSPPIFPDIRVVNDIVVPDVGWTMEEIHVNVIEDAGWSDGGVVETYLYAHDSGTESPGEHLMSFDSGFTKMATGDWYYSREDYEYWIGPMDVELPAGTYWIGIRNPNAGGAGTNYALLSDGGRDGPGSRISWHSLDGGVGRGTRKGPRGQNTRFLFAVSSDSPAASCPMSLKSRAAFASAGGWWRWRRAMTAT